LARLGGDEFCVLLDEVTANEANGVAEKLRRAVEEAEFFPDEYKIPIKYTISIGVAPIHHGALEFRQLISRADYALYQAKER
jgi:diguanylate cyclase (GGDEF)-like protein